MHPRTFWALVLIVAGVVLLLGNLNLIPGNAWNYIWPLFLILLGVTFLLGTARRGGAPQSRDSLALDGAGSARIKFGHGAGHLRVRAGADANLLYEGVFGGDVNRKVNRSGDRLDVALRTDPAAWAPWNWWGANALDWDVSLNPNVPLELEFETGASDSELDLSGLRVSDIKLQTGASATAMTMPRQAGMTRARIESGAASVKVRIPDGVAARISGVMGLGALEVDSRRFPKRGGEYESDDYAGAVNRVELVVEGGVGAVNVS